MYDLPFIKSTPGVGGNAAAAGYPNALGSDGFALYAALAAAALAAPAHAGGAKLVSWPFDPRTTDAASTAALVSGRIMLVPQLVKGGIQIDGVAWVQTVAGVYTAANSNQTAAYTYDGSNFTRVAFTASDGTLWKGVPRATGDAGTMAYIPATDMILWAAAIWNSSATTTAPQILGSNMQDPGATNLFLNFAPTPGFVMETAVTGANPNLPATIANASLNNGTTANYWLAFYHIYP